MLKFRLEPFTSAALSRRCQNAPLRWKLASLNIQNLLFNLQTHYGKDLAERKLSHGNKFCILLWTQTARLNVPVIYCRSGFCSPEPAHVKILLVQERTITLLSRGFTILNSTAGQSQWQASAGNQHETDEQTSSIWIGLQGLSFVLLVLFLHYDRTDCEEPQRPEAHQKQVPTTCSFL